MTNPVVRQHLAGRVDRGARILRWNLLRTMSSLTLGTTAPVTNVYKLFWASFHQELGELAIEVMGADATLARVPGRTRSTRSRPCSCTRAPRRSTAARTRSSSNIVGERELGLPREP